MPEQRNFKAEAAEEKFQSLRQQRQADHDREKATEAGIPEAAIKTYINEQYPGANNNP